MADQVFHPQAPQLPSRNEFDEAGYLLLHPDVAAGVASGAVASGWQHFSLHGFAEGRQWLAQPDPLAGVIREISPRDEMFVDNEAHYFDVGASAWHCLETALFATHRNKSTVRNILDLPCGHGRVLRFLKKAFPHAELTACDLNRDGVEFCARVFGAVPVLSQEEPEAIPLDARFDLIWCGSLLTHLTEERCRDFIRLFQRLLRPGGILVFTTHGRLCERELVSGKNRCGLTDQQIARLLAQYHERGFGYVDYIALPGYGFSLARPAFILEHLAQDPAWRLINFQEGGWDKRQDAVCLQKNPVGNQPAMEPRPSSRAEG